MQSDDSVPEGTCKVCGLAARVPAHREDDAWFEHDFVPPNQGELFVDAGSPDDRDIMSRFDDPDTEIRRGR